MSSFYTSSSPIASSPRSSLRGRSVTPDIIEPVEFSSGAGGGGGGGGFNLADELAMADNSDEDNEEEEEGGQTGHLDESGYLGIPTGRGSVLSVRSDYEGSEYGDIDEDDSDDGYLSDRVDTQEVELRKLVEEYSLGGRNAVTTFVDELRGMRGQMDVENHTRR
jgi:hypothetical protein